MPLRPRLTSDCQGVALEDIFGETGSVGGRAVILALLLLASLWLVPNGMGVIQGDLVEGFALLFFVKLVCDGTRSFIHRASKHNGLPRLHLLIQQDRELDFIHRGWKAGKGLAVRREVGKRENLTRPLVKTSYL